MKGGNFNKTISLVLDKAISEQNNMHDSCFLVGGMEGSGKSDLILECINYIDEKRNIQTPIENIAYNLGDFFLSLKTSNQGDCVSLDEGKELMSMNYGDKKLKDAINIFTVIRKKRLITFLAFTNPTKITQYFREDRIRGVFLLKKRKKNYSIIYYYTKTQFNKILSILRMQRSLNIQSIFKHKPLFICCKYGAYEGRLKIAYESGKDDNIEHQLDLLVNKYHKKDNKTYSLTETCKLMDCSSSLMKKILPIDFRDKYRDSFGIIKFDDEAIKEINKLISTYKNKPIKRNNINKYIKAKESIKTKTISTHLIKGKKYGLSTI